MPSDEERRQVAHLGSDRVRDQLQQALDAHGLRLNRFHLHELQHRPGAGATGVFEVHAAAAAGDEQELFLGLTAESLRLPPQDRGSTTVPAGRAVGAEWTAWFHPHDPRLPGLALAADPASVAQLWSGGQRLLSLRTVSYRPLRRAVLRAVFDARDPDRESAGQSGRRGVALRGSRSAAQTAGTPLPGQPPLPPTRTVYLKVLRPGQSADLHRRHVVMAAAGVPVAPALAPPVAEVLALGAGTGQSLAAELLADGAARMDPDALIDPLDRMPPELLELPRRESWAERVADYGGAAAVALPAQSSRIRSLVREVERLMGTTDPGPVVPVHGDFYEANVLVQDGAVSCLLDIDGAGPGHRVDDLACLVGHVAVLPSVDRRYVHAGRAVDRLYSHFSTLVDPAGLAARSAAVALSLVAGARSRGQGWQTAARGRLDAAEALLGRA